MQSMKAVRIHSYGGREVLVYEDAPMPQPGEGEVLVRIAASSVNPFDCAARSGYMVDYYQYTFPRPGLDVAGVIESTGSSANGFSRGDAVYGRANPAKNGAYAEYIALPASQIAHKPRTLDYLQAASVPHVAAFGMAGAHQYRKHLSRANCTHPRCGRRRGHLRRAVR